MDKQNAFIWLETGKTDNCTITPIDNKITPVEGEREGDQRWGGRVYKEYTVRRIMSPFNQRASKASSSLSVRHLHFPNPLQTKLKNAILPYSTYSQPFLSHLISNTS